MNNIPTKKRKRTFQETWLSDSRYNPWIQTVSSNDSIYHCNYCEKDILCSTFPSNHAKSQCHKKNVDAIVASSNINIYSDSNNSDDDTDHSIVENDEKKSKKYNFQQSWLEKPEFQSWLREVPDNSNLFQCLLCDNTMIGGWSRIQDHAKSKKHIQNNEKNDAHTIKDNNLLVDELVLPFDVRKKMAEIRYAAFIAEKNLPCTMANEILKFFQQEGKDPNVLKSMTMCATKCKNIITNVLAPIETERVVKTIKNCRFSISIDETTDISKMKWVTFVVRYVNPETLNVCSQLIKLIDINASDTSAEKLFDSFKHEMLQLNVPFDNVIALSCDNASVMSGSYNSFKTKLENHCKKLITINCPCHSSSLIARIACTKIPDKSEIFVKNIATFINDNPKHSALYKEFASRSQEAKHKILNLADTRWLSRNISIGRILESWNTIKMFLTDMPITEKLSSGKYLLDIMNCNDVKGYLLFLKYILDCFNSFNVFFQTTETRIHQLQPKSLMLLNTITKNILKPEYIKMINKDFDFSCKEYHKPLPEIDLGSECQKYLRELKNDGYNNVVTDIRAHCLEFYICAAQEICKRLPINDQFLSKLKVCNHEIAFCDANREISYDDINFIAKTLIVFDDENLKKEWMALPQKFTVDQKNKFALLKFDEMWKEVFQQNDSFPNLKLLLNTVRSLPNSNIDSELIFSYLPNVKTKKRNKLSNASVNAICIIKSALKMREESASMLQITDSHLSLYRTAAVAHNGESANFLIEVYALMFANNGICCIDDFDKMDPKNQAADTRDNGTADDSHSEGNVSKMKFTIEGNNTYE